MSEKVLVVKLEKTYGVERIYPVCPDSKIFASLLEQETLTREDINKIKKLGYKVTQQVPGEL